MPEEDGTGRLDRIERVLERIARDHEQFRHDMKQHLVAQVLQANDERVDKLVIGVGEFIRSRPNATQ